MNRQRILLLIITGLLLTGYAIIHDRAHAASPQPPTVEDAAQSGDDEREPPSDDYCLLCHENTDLEWHLPSGESLSLSIDPAVISQSVHGNPESQLACVDCHQNYRFPHTTPDVETLREFVLERYASCRSCHEEQYLHAQDSVHGAALRDGQLDVAVCIDCHGGHDIQPPDEPRERISLTCGSCHGAILDLYSTSVHGETLFAEQNPDVPTCIDCHGVHNIADPTTAAFRVRSPELCTNCHADEELMEKYDISTNIEDSYLTDFHGTTVAFFEQQDPDVATNKAVCYDCHGVHDIQQVEEADVRENLLATCRQCHPDADANFPEAWVGHYEPTLERNPTLVIADTIYDGLLPGFIGIFAVLIATDIFRRLRRHS
ncbi:MAG: cytochrome c3 family protein [Chloroflexi bacterium]|nr:cytochrome c3 family protein [Chloroflexota bacterium]